MRFRRLEQVPATLVISGPAFVAPASGPSLRASGPPAELFDAEDADWPMGAMARLLSDAEEAADA